MGAKTRLVKQVETILDVPLIEGSQQSRRSEGGERSQRSIYSVNTGPILTEEVSFERFWKGNVLCHQIGNIYYKT